MTRSTLFIAAILTMVMAPVLARAGNFYAGALGGIATLGADGRSIPSPSGSQVSLYKPENGPAMNLFAGWDFSDYVSVQGNYIWNRNNLTLVSTGFGPQGPVAYQELRKSQQNSVIGDVLIYFRKRGSRVRPYLSGGAGAVHLASTSGPLSDVTGSPQLPPQEFSSTNIGLRVAVGMDVRLRKGWAFRYSFSETMSHNPISDELSPPGQRGLKNFQNLFGFVKRF
ncbi:MAG: outer membrane beta-barrel protein [Terriglobia bacterium]